MTRNPRYLALQVLDRVERSGELLDPVMEEVLAGEPFADPRDRALFHALVFGVLRWRGRLDWTIRRFSKTPLEKIDPHVMNVLRMGLFQAVYLDRIPVSAAVNTSVELAKKSAPAWVVGFVNALLRNAAKNWKKVPFPDPAKKPAQHLAARYSLPRWLVRRWIDRFGAAEAEALFQAVNEIPPITARVNTLVADRMQLIAALETTCQKVRPGALCADAVLFERPAVPISSLAGYRGGWFQVQDEAAQLVIRLLDPRPGEKILDACAGLGGKTGHVAQLMDNRGKIVAAEKDGAKVLRLVEEMRRLGVSIVDSRQCDLLSDAFSPDETFDRVLLDAPCTGLGVLRKNPDARWRTEKQGLARYAALQGRLLARVSQRVRPGGVLVYAVCTFEPEETTDVVDAFVKARPQFAVESVPSPGVFPERGLIDHRGFFRTLPHRHDTDGFFAARLIRKTETKP